MFESKFCPHDDKNKKSSFLIFLHIKSFITRVLLTIIVTLLVLIGFKLNLDFKQQFNQYVYHTSFPFAKVKEFYQSHFGESFVTNKIDSTIPVFSEKLTYSKKNLYKDGVALTVDEHYMVPSFNSGIVVFIGQKDNYQNTVIVQQMDGVDVWYGNINTSSVKLYDYIEKGSLIGEVKDKTLYLVFQKDGQFMDYKNYVE